jgi:hypothetical protein
LCFCTSKIAEEQASQEIISEEGNFRNTYL